MAEPLIQIVDANDQPKRGATKGEAQQLGLWHRIVKILLRDSDGNVLLQRRAGGVLSPGCWDFSTSGHVDIGEDYNVAALRELQEEIGVQGVSLREIDRTKYEKTDEAGRIFRRFAVTFTGVVDHNYPFKLDPNEVAAVKWLTVKQTEEFAKASPEEVTSGLRQLLESGVWK